MLVYAIWRGTYLNATSIAQHPEKIIGILKSEIDTSKRELERLRELAVEDTENALENSLFSISNHGTKGAVYSPYSTIATNRFSDLNSFTIKATESAEDARQQCEDFRSSSGGGILYLHVEDSLDVLELLPNFADLIIGDPPYGFNTSEGGNDRMIDLFNRLLPTMIDATVDGGEVAAAIPLQARHGRQFPFFQTNEHIEDQVMRHLADKGHVASWSPTPFGGVYSPQGFGHAYWSSASALVRGVLTVRIASHATERSQ